MSYLVRGEATPEAVHSYLKQALEFAWGVHDSGNLSWGDEPGYIQWAGWPEGVQIECSSDQFLDRQLEDGELQVLQELGFHSPTDELPNHWQRIESVDALDAAASALVTVLFTVLTPAVDTPVPPMEPGVEPHPTRSSSVGYGAARLITIAPVGKVDARAIAALAAAAVRASAGPVAVLDAFGSKGVGGSTPAEWRQVTYDDLASEVVKPWATDAVLRIAGWPGGDADPLLQLQVAADVVQAAERLRHSGWTVLLIGPWVFPHMHWLYEHAALPLTDGLLLVGSASDWEYRTDSIDFLLGRVPRHPGALPPVAALDTWGDEKQPSQLMPQLPEHLVDQQELAAAGSPEWLSQWLTTAVGEATPDQPDSAAADIPVPAVLLRVNQGWHAGIDEDALYDVVHGWWVMGPKRERAEYAFAVAKGIVRGVYAIHGWRPRHSTDAAGKPQTRWGFDGEPSEELAHLIGLDVRHYFPAGSANPVRYIGCDEPAVGTALRGRKADLTTTPADDGAALQQLAKECDRLRDNPVLHMSLGSKELFHSNFLAWLVERNWEMAAAALIPWLTIDPEQTALRVRREAHNLDLVIEVPGYTPLVIENKMFSAPDEHQLAGYAEINIPALGISNPSKVLLSLSDPGWVDNTYDGWRWMPYTSLVSRLGQAMTDHPVADPFSAELIRHWFDLIESLERLVELTRPVALAAGLLLGGDEVELLRGVRLHDGLQKFRTAAVRRMLARKYADEGLTYDFIESNFTTGSPLLSTAVDLPDGSRIGWQLQGSQWRRFVIVPAELAGKTEAAKLRRIEYVKAHHLAWFTFRAEQALGPFQPAQTSTFKHYAPDFVYDYIKVPGASVGLILELGTDTLRAAHAYRDGWPAVTSKGAE